MSPSKTVVLVVENHPLVRACLVEAVWEANFEALDVGSASEAIETLEGRSDIRLVFAEIELPATSDGIVLAYLIRTRWRSMSLIVTSGKPGFQTERLPAGTRFFPRPYHDAAVVREMVDLLSPAGEA